MKSRKRRNKWMDGGMDDGWMDRGMDKWMNDFWGFY
jgi:hypothetical protein